MRLVFRVPARVRVRVCRCAARWHPAVGQGGGAEWQVVTTSRHQSPPATTSHQGTTSHHQSPPVATSHHQPPPVATSRHQSPPVATNHHQSPPVATDHHQPDPSFLHQKGNHDKHIHRPHRLVVRFDSFVPRLPFTRCWTSTQRNFVDASKRSSCQQSSSNKTGAGPARCGCRSIADAMRMS